MPIAITALFALMSIGALASATTTRSDKHQFTVQDSIAWTHVMAFSVDMGRRTRQVALFSPDGSHFVLHTRRGNLARNVNVDSLLLFVTREVDVYAQSLKSRTAVPKATQLVAMDAHKDEDSLSAVRWIDNSQIGFLSRDPRGRMQAFSVDIATRNLTQLTESATDVMGFSLAGNMLAYYACVPQAQRESLVVVVSSFKETLPPGTRGDSPCYSGTPIEFFAGAIGSPPKRFALPAMLLYPHLRTIWLAPGGDHAVIVAPAVNAPSSWAEYGGPDRERFGFSSHWVRADPKSMDLLSRTRYLLIDLDSGVVKPLLDAPTGP